MCQILAIKTQKAKIAKILKNPSLEKSIMDVLSKKGGDYYSVDIACGESIIPINFGHKDQKIFENILKNLKEYASFGRMKKKDQLTLIFFSRQRPEMEMEYPPIEQPYINQVDPGLLLAVHGTIYNDEELSKKYNLKLGADTEFFRGVDLSRWKDAEGTFAIIGVKVHDAKNHELIKLQHGLKIWSKSLILNNKYFGDIVSTDPLSFIQCDVKDISSEIYPTSNTRTLFASFSAGMDISLSVFKELSTGQYDKAVLNYFAWGSIAEESETLQLSKFQKLYAKYFPGIDIKIDIIEATSYFDNFFEITEAPYPKISYQNSEGVLGDEKETESPLAYVPYRNTQFAMMLAAKAEAANITDCTFVFGLNLSEGMVFMDNSEGWLINIQETLNLGGKDHKTVGSYKVAAPYVTRTKTNMLKDFLDEFGLEVLEDILSNAVSCYYPDSDGNNCGKCGSCILRAKSMQKLIDIER